MGKEIIALGSLVVDITARAPRAPLPGESLVGAGFGIFTGGKGLNQAVAAARSGAIVHMIGKVGNDAFAPRFFTAMAEEHIDAAFVQRDAVQNTGAALITVLADSGQNTIVVNPNANLAVTEEDVQEAFRALGPSSGVFITQCETSRVSYSAGLRAAKSYGLKTVWNIAPIPSEPLPDALFALADYLFVNEVEAAFLTNIAAADSPETARNAGIELLRKGARNVFVTLGAKGVVWVRLDSAGSPESWWMRAFTVDQVDATAAGDAMCGVFAAQIAAGKGAAASLRRAVAAGALAVTRMGALPSIPNTGEIDAFLTQFAAPFVL